MANIDNIAMKYCPEICMFTIVNIAPTMAIIKFSYHSIVIIFDVKPILPNERLRGFTLKAVRREVLGSCPM